MRGHAPSPFAALALAPPGVTRRRPIQQHSGDIMRRTALLGAVALAACGPSAASTTPAPARETVTAAELRRDLMVFASDSFMGREAGTPGELRAVRFLESRVRQLGLRPAGDSGFVQRVPLVRQRFARATRFVVTNRREQTTIP